MNTRRGLDWQNDARCSEVSPELFFLDQGASSANAKQICKGCPVRVACLEYALADTSIQDGIWGGLTTNERARLQSRRRSAAA